MINKEVVEWVKFHYPDYFYTAARVHASTWCDVDDFAQQLVVFVLSRSHTYRGDNILRWVRSQVNYGVRQAKIDLWEQPRVPLVVGESEEGYEQRYKKLWPHDPSELSQSPIWRRLTVLQHMVLSDLELGHSHKQIAEKHGVSVTRVSLWVREIKQVVHDYLTPE